MAEAALKTAAVHPRALSHARRMWAQTQVGVIVRLLRRGTVWAMKQGERGPIVVGHDLRAGVRVACLAALALFGASACDPVVERRQTGAPRFEERRESCSKLGYCFTCMPGFNGKMECGMKLSAFCPGERLVDVRVTPVREVHKSGKITDMDDVTELAVVSACE